jgi:molecular chaperone GrpE
MDETKPGNGTIPANDTEGAATPALEEQLAAAEAKAVEANDKMLRAMAEVENTRRRLERERDEARKYAASAFARDLLSAADNLRRALASMPEDQAADEATKSLLAGVAATERELLAAFEKHGIRRLDPKGERFDHNFHQAIFEAENTGKPAGTVVEVLQPGYIQHDRLLRPAMVGVAKGGATAKAGPDGLPELPEEPGMSEPARPGERLDTTA